VLCTSQEAAAIGVAHICSAGDTAQGSLTGVPRFARFSRSGASFPSLLPECGPSRDEDRKRPFIHSLLSCQRPCSPLLGNREKRGTLFFSVLTIQLRTLYFPPRCGPPASQLVFATVRPMRAITIVKLVHDDRVTAAKHLGFARAVSIFSSCVQEKL
jgi:hypothetical protein